MLYLLLKYDCDNDFSLSLLYCSINSSYCLQVFWRRHTYDRYSSNLWFKWMRSKSIELWFESHILLSSVIIASEQRFLDKICLFYSYNSVICFINRVIWFFFKWLFSSSNSFTLWNNRLVVLSLPYFISVIKI